MSAPNEPGQPGPGETPGNGNGSADPGAPRAASGANGGSAEAPPWQRGAARPRQGATPPRPAADAGVRPEPRPAPAGASSPSIEARVNRFITGSAAPDLSTVGGASAPRQETRPEARQDPEPAAARPESRAERTEVTRPEAYASELPDLSVPAPKPVQPRKAVAGPPGRAPNRPPRRPPPRPPASRSVPTGRADPCAPACRSATSTRGAR